jgi:1,2-phenylacetyl-CoA epoxidase catalytic subunit
VFDLRSMRGVEVESDHFFVRVKIRLKVTISEKTKKSERKWDIGKLNKNEVKEEFIKEVTANAQNLPYIYIYTHTHTYIHTYTHTEVACPESKNTKVLKHVQHF